MSVLDGPRRERRRILFEGAAHWVGVEGDQLTLGNGRTLPEGDAIYLPPCSPRKIICVHVNSESRFAEFNDESENPSYFQKPTTSLNAHRGALYRPDNCQYLNYEGEIAIEIGIPFRNLDPEDVWTVISGFMPANDVGLQDFRDIDRGSMLRVKGMDGFCPLGPGIVSGVDIRKESVRTYRNGDLVQEGSVEEYVFSMGFLLADLSRYMTFEVGDVILTGTPANSRPMEIGDVIEVDVSNVGKLTNYVKQAPRAPMTIGHQPTDSDNVRRIALGGDFTAREETE